GASAAAEASGTAGEAVCPFSAQVRSMSALAGTRATTSSSPHSPLVLPGSRPLRIHMSWNDLLSHARHHCLPLTWLYVGFFRSASATFSPSVALASSEPRATSSTAL